MSDTELTVSLPLQVKVDLRGLDFKGLVQAIGKAADAACSELLGQMVRAVERRALAAQPHRWVNRGPLSRRVQVSWGTVPIRRTRVRDRITGATYNLGDRLLQWRPYVRRSVEAVRTACELAASMSYRQARHWWQRLTGGRCSVMNFWRMVQGAERRREVCAEVRGYLDGHAAVLYTHEEWERRTTVRKMGSGVIEKTIETQIHRRMKRRGMSG